MIRPSKNLFVLLLTSVALAQGYAPGERVIFNRLGEVMEGEIVRRDGGQYVIRHQGPFGPDERYYDASVILRRAGPQPPPQPQVQPQPQPQPQPPIDPGPGQILFNYHGEIKPGEIIRREGGRLLIRFRTQWGWDQRYFDPDVLVNGPAPVPEPVARPIPAPAPPLRPAPDPNPGATLSENDVLNFLRQRLGGNPWGPNRKNVTDELEALVKGRGVNFQFATDTPFYQELMKFGATTEITRPLDANFGPPPNLERLLGSWQTEVNPITPEQDVKRGGFLTMNGDQTYQWRLNTGETIRGTWRAASAAEMQDMGGAGVVLSSGRGGHDWLVSAYRDPGPANMGPQWIQVEELTTRGERVFGNR